jgi:hypothetical protein
MCSTPNGSLPSSLFHLNGTFYDDNISTLNSICAVQALVRFVVVARLASVADASGSDSLQSRRVSLPPQNTASNLLLMRGNEESIAYSVFLYQVGGSFSWQDPQRAVSDDSHSS